MFVFEELFFVEFKKKIRSLLFSRFVSLSYFAERNIFWFYPKIVEFINVNILAIISQIKHCFHRFYLISIKMIITNNVRIYFIRAIGKLYYTSHGLKSPSKQFIRLIYISFVTYLSKSTRKTNIRNVVIL